MPDRCSVTNNQETCKESVPSDVEDQANIVTSATAEHSETGEPEMVRDVHGMHVDANVVPPWSENHWRVDIICRTCG